MTGDFSRQTFDRKKHYLRVLMQQGRVLLDADWNEQAAILLHYLQTLATDLIGPHGGPGESFKIAPRGDKRDFSIQAGHYYVNGRLCENESDSFYTEQLEYPLTNDDHLGDRTYLVYLDVWERHVTWIEDHDIREVALNGPDTATRAKSVWQAKAQETALTKCSDLTAAAWKNLIELWQPSNRGLLMAHAEGSSKKGKTGANQSCTIAPDARYLGPENHLYRVEIHAGGEAQHATFKWSRDNGAVIFPIQTASGSIVVVEDFGRDPQRTLQKNDWVEIMDSDLAKHGKAGPLVQIESVDLVEKTVMLAGSGNKEYDENDSRRPYLRKWESGARTIELTKLETLESGIQIRFHGNAPTFRTGDYWLIPARTANHDIDWPQNSDGTPQALRPHGVTHHYAPLAIITVAGGKVGVDATTGHCCGSFTPLCDSAVGQLPPDYDAGPGLAAIAPTAMGEKKSKARSAKKTGG